MKLNNRTTKATEAPRYTPFVAFVANFLGLKNEK